MFKIYHTHLLPYTWLSGPQKQGEMPMNTKYKALLKLMTVPVLLYVEATSGTAAKIVVEDIGAKKEQYDSKATMTTFLEGFMRS